MGDNPRGTTYTAIRRTGESVMSLLDNVEQKVSEMSEDELRKAFLSAQEETAKRKEKQKEYNTKPENKEKRLAYQKKRNEELKTDPEKLAKVKEQRKAYMEKNKDKMKAYRTKRNEYNKLVMARAKELGIDKQISQAQPNA